MQGRIQEQRQLSRQQYNAWRSIVNNDLIRQAQEAQAREDIGDFGKNLVMGGQGQHTYEWYKSHTDPNDVAGQKFLAEVLRGFQKDASRPKAVPGPPKGVKP
jgi:hypothetical protein